MQVNLSKNLVIPAGLLLLLAGGVYGFGRSSARADQTESKLYEHLAESKAMREKAEASRLELERGLANAKESLGTRVTTLEVTISNMNQALGRIEGKLDRPSGVVQAGGRR